MNFKKTLQAAAVGAAFIACSSTASASMAQYTCSNLLQDFAAMETKPDGAYTIAWCAGYFAGRMGAEALPGEAVEALVAGLGEACQQMPDELVINVLESAVEEAASE